MLTTPDARPPDLRRRLKLPALLGGMGVFGLLGCIACCSLPLIGAIGAGAAAAYVFEVLEPLSIGLLAVGALGALAVIVRLRMQTCTESDGQATSCATDGSCGCGPGEPALRAPVER